MDDKTRRKIVRQHRLETAAFVILAIALITAGVWMFSPAAALITLGLSFALIAIVPLVVKREEG